MNWRRTILPVVTLFITLSLAAQPVAEPASEKKDTTDPYYIDFTGVEFLKGDSEKKEEPKTETKKDTSNPFSLDFSKFDWGVDAKKDEPKTEVKKDTTNPFSLDFSKFDWNTELSGNRELPSTVIGSQTWAANNLNVAAFRNGDAIPEAKNSSDWEVAYYNKQPIWCYYNYDPANGTKYGRLYNVFAIVDKRGLAPAGWHIPSQAEWEKAKTVVPADAAKMRSVEQGGYGFVQGGYLGHNDFVAIGSAGCWWSATPKTVYGAYGGSINQGAVGFVFNKDYPTFYDGSYSTQGLSVRCVKD